MKKTDKLILIDGNSLVNRAFYALPPLSSIDGLPSNAVYGFATMLIKLINDYAPQYIAVAFDMRAPTFRHKMYREYKATRKGMPDDLAAQLPLLKEMLSAMKIKILEQEGVEADDIIGTVAKRHLTETLIVTGDRDSLQLIDDKTSVLITKKGISEIALMNEHTIVETYGLTPAQIIDYKALAGDASDNIPGVGGVGDKTATELLTRYGTLNGVYENIAEIKGKLAEKLINDKDMAFLSYELATIKTDCCLDVDIAACRYDFPFSAAVMDNFVRLGFKSLVKRAELFTENAPQVEKRKAAETVTLKSIDEFVSKIKGLRSFAFALGGSISVSPGGVQYEISVEPTLLEPAPDTGEVLAALRPTLEDGTVVKYVYDAKKVLRTLEGCGIRLNNYRDVALMQYLTDIRIKYSDCETYASDCGYKKEQAAVCIAERAALLEKELAAEGMMRLYYELELPLINVLRGMEKSGFLLDLELLARLGKDYEKQEAECGERVTALAGRSFNINSPKQLAVVLFDELKIPYPKKGGAVSTSAEILSMIEGYEIVDEVLRYRFLSKIRSTYIEGLMKVADSRGAVHTEFNQMLTTTGRLSSSEPNLQNIPVREDESRELRGAFIAGEGNVLIAADYSQIELRVMAHLSGDRNLTAAFERGEDIHTAVACELFDITPALVTGKMRRIAKTVNFGIIYGMSAYGLATRLKLPNRLAKEYIDKYFERFSGVKKYLDGIIEQAKKTGCAVSILGRKRVISELKSSDFRTRSFGERAAMNMPLQSSAADIIKLAMLRVSEKLVGKCAKLILQVHDELIIEAPEGEAEEVAAMLKEEMETAIKLSVPLVAEVKIGKNWLECK